MGKASRLGGGTPVYQSRFADLFDTAMVALRLENREIQERTKDDGSGKPPINEKTIGAFRKTTFDRRVTTRTRRRLERAMRVFNEYLEGRWPTYTPEEQARRVLARDLPPGAEYPPHDRPGRAHAAPETPGDTISAGSITSTLAFVRGQLDGYRRDGRPIPYPIVESWLGELEAAAREPATGPVIDAGGSGSGSPATAPPRHTSRAR